MRHAATGVPRRAQRPGPPGVEQRAEQPAGRAGAARSYQLVEAEWREHRSRVRHQPVDSSEVEGKTYEASGVSLALAESSSTGCAPPSNRTGTSGFGAFAGLYPLDEQRLLAASIDSVGTKLVLARKAGRLRSTAAPTWPRTASTT